MFIAIILTLASGLWATARRSSAGRNEIVVEINKPPLEVFLWLLEPEKLKQWVAGLTQITQLTPGAVTMGTKSRDVLQIGSETTVLNVAIDLFTNVVRCELSGQNGTTCLAYSAITNLSDDSCRLRLEFLLRAPLAGLVREASRRLVIGAYIPDSQSQ